uniref:Uncharacterized protein n=1 Tax=Leptobrachium leishanense TaxID=445787 RepID=A0A8C5N4F2_9ANUR
MQRHLRREVRIYKIILLGSTNVGKSSMILHLVKNNSQVTDSTIGGAFCKYKLFLQDKALEFLIWDTAGQERFQSVCRMYYRGATAALLVYDVTRKILEKRQPAGRTKLSAVARPQMQFQTYMYRLLGGLMFLCNNGETFSRAQVLLHEVEKYFKQGEVIVFLIGNKKDLQSERKVSQEEGQAFAASKGILFLETSAETGDNVEDVFETVAWELLDKDYNVDQKDSGIIANFTIEEEARTPQGNAAEMKGSNL